MLTAAEDHIKSINPNAEVYLFGQEINAGVVGDLRVGDAAAQTSPARIYFGNSFSDDGYRGKKFDYMLANPPFGVEWKKVKDEVEAEAELGYAGRFGAGLPRINDGSFLFLQHMISKMEPVEDKGARGWRSSSTARRCSPAPPSPASRRSGGGSWRTTGWKASSRCRTSCSTTPESRRTSGSCPTGRPTALRGKVILLDARDQWEKMRKSLGDKRKDDQRRADRPHHRLYVNALAVAADPAHPDHGKVKIFGTRDFGYHRITVERPLKLRFEITEDTLAALEASKPLAKWDGRDALVAALRGLLGTVWWTKKEAPAALHAAASSGGVLWPSSAPS